MGLLLPAVCPTALPHPTLLHSNHRLYVEREINIILCLIVCFIVFIYIFWGLHYIKNTFLIGYSLVQHEVKDRNCDNFREILQQGCFSRIFAADDVCRLI